MATPRSISYLNALWVTGYIPTQTDFEDLFASYSNLVDNNALDLTDLNITAYAGGRLTPINLQNVLTKLLSLGTGAR